jgi:hypothetical protein
LPDHLPQGVTRRRGDPIAIGLQARDHRRQFRIPALAASLEEVIDNPSPLGRNEQSSCWIHLWE